MNKVNLFSAMSGNKPYASNSIKQQNQDPYKLVPLGTNPSGLKSKEPESGRDLMKAYLGLD